MENVNLCEISENYVKLAFKTLTKFQFITKSCITISISKLFP